MHTVTRRSFVTSVAAATLAPACALLVQPAGADAGAVREASRRPGRPLYLFFDRAEAQFIEAACERLIPTDDCGPGALMAGVPGYLDRQLGGSWGAGTRPYRSGSWQPGTPAAQGRRPVTPAQLFRGTLLAINRGFERNGTSFGELTFDSQRAFLVALESGTACLGAPSRVFFDMLLKMTVEGFFSHPVYGMTRDRVAWRIEGFPGAHAAAS